MSLGSLIVVIMWLILIGLLVWAMAAGRREAASAGYKLQARLVDVKPRVLMTAAAPASSAGASPAAAGRAARAGAAAAPASEKEPASPHPVA